MSAPMSPELTVALFIFLPLVVVCVVVAWLQIVRARGRVNQLEEEYIEAPDRKS